jgi:hypothetical protein
MRTLTRYVSRDVLFSTLLIFTALLMLFSFFDLINEMKDVGKGSYTLTAAVLFVALNIPSRLYELFPVAALIGTLFAIAQLVANSEWTVMRASGASVMQLGWAVVRVGIPLALATFLAGEFVSPTGGTPGADAARERPRRCHRPGRAAVRFRLLVQAGPDLRKHPHRTGRHEAGRHPNLRIRPAIASDDGAQREQGASRVMESGSSKA